MDPSYSAFADWLSKVHTAPPLIQALWILAGPATLVGLRSPGGLRSMRSTARPRGAGCC